MIDTMPAENAEEIGAPLSGNIWKVMVLPHQKINEGDVLVILEAMKMETVILYLPKACLIVPLRDLVIMNN
jgi:oxaloacetate decarboxylase alpha subunit